MNIATTAVLLYHFAVHLVVRESSELNEFYPAANDETGLEAVILAIDTK